MFELINVFIDLFVLSATWLLFGFAIAGLIDAFLNKDFLLRHIGGDGFLPTLKAALIGAPLPLCSCGVVPVALGLRKAGASKNSTVSFLIATPETGVDSVLFTNALMGPIMAAIRPIAAISSAIVAGILVGGERYKQHSGLIPSTEPPTSCCANKKDTSNKPQENATLKIPLHTKLKEGMVFSYDKMLRNIVNWLLIGLVIAAIMKTYLPGDFFEHYGQGLLAMVVMAIIGVPMYVCAIASTPIAAGFLLSGLSPGAVLVFMLVGPASNIGTLAIIKKSLGTRSIIAYLIGVVITAFAFGFSVDYMFEQFGFNVYTLSEMKSHQTSSTIDRAMAIALALLCIRALFLNFKNTFILKPQEI